LFDIDKYHQLLQTQWLGQSLLYFEELDSTNTYMKNLPAGEVAHGQLCLVDHQSRGRGQYERNWETEPGKNLTFTLVFRPSGAERFHVLTLACVRAAVAEIEDSFGCQAFVKWPNDLIINQKKAAGFLAEAVFNGNRLDRLLIGIGMNVNQKQFPHDLQQKAISLRQAAGCSVDREAFLSLVLSRIEYAYTRWLKQDDELVKWINQKIIGYGQWVRMRVNGFTDNKEYKLLGINQKGHLTGISRGGDLETFSYEQIRLITR
jgi:BirA family biotin operon repressor/biotin-[acetyl-CoA-carboxylase] ligase